MGGRCGDGSVSSRSSLTLPPFQDVPILPGPPPVPPPPQASLSCLSARLLWAAIIQIENSREKLIVLKVHRFY